jgi:hypothetical protein
MYYSRAMPMAPTGRKQSSLTRPLRILIKNRIKYFTLSLITIVIRANKYLFI